MFCFDFRLGECYVGLGEADKAIEVLQKHCVDLRKSGGGTTSYKHQVQVYSCGKFGNIFLMYLFNFIDKNN